MQADFRLIGVQVTTVDGKVYGKVFVGEDPDGQTEAVCSIMTMVIRDEACPEVLAQAKSLSLGDWVRLSIETERGGKQVVKNVVTDLRALPKQAPAARPAQ